MGVFLFSSVLAFAACAALDLLMLELDYRALERGISREHGHGHD
jgi:hypothetical protein